MTQKSSTCHLFGMLQCQHKTRETDAGCTDQRQLHRDKRIRPSEKNKNDTQQDGIQCLGQIQCADPLDVGNDRPSFAYNIPKAGQTTEGICAKSESSRTICADCFAASLPAAIAIPQSASFSASTSLTPSPTIPTTFFSD